MHTSSGGKPCFCALQLSGIDSSTVSEKSTSKKAYSHDWHFVLAIGWEPSRSCCPSSHGPLHRLTWSYTWHCSRLPWVSIQKKTAASISRPMSGSWHSIISDIILLVKAFTKLVQIQGACGRRKGAFNNNVSSSWCNHLCQWEEYKECMIQGAHSVYGHFSGLHHSKL